MKNKRWEVKIVENAEVKILTVADVKEKLKIGRNNAYKIFSREDFPAILLGRKYVVEENALKNWLQKRRK